ncbi:hypothetical protein PASE110613_12375 [Paenibacillus sediminis]|uniref:Uncharacterized protein n=1 Tax=Paenibacillus sediminis TaxID=664909 RepID=A0ABS4H578_9BACL|nr:hypothetical protein [Paenibacillus sediminis]MBP1937679.1 hypothetical protein [Paenibacillus sediminis]
MKRMNLYAKIATKIVLALLVVLLTLHHPASVKAASMELSPAQKSNLDKTTASTDRALAGKINALYSTFLTLQVQDQKIDQNISTLHYSNEEALAILRKQIKLIDAEKLSKLDNALKQTKERYKPLFDLYSTLNKQIAAARKLKNKELSSALRSQADTVKIAVQLAREDIQAKEHALAAAKDEAGKKIKKIRNILSEIDPLIMKIKAERSTATILKRNVSPMWKTLTQSIKDNDAKRTESSLTNINSLLRQISEQKQKMMNLEGKISGIIQSARAQMPIS